MKKLFTLIAITGLFSIVCYAQKEIVGTPYTFLHKDISYSVDKAVLPELDVDELIREDALNYKNGTPLRLGYVHHVSFTFSNSGRTDILPDGSKLWRMIIRSKDAVMLDIFFSKFNIPEGAMLHIYTPDHSQLTGTYTNKDIQENGVLAAEDIIGDEAVIEYFEPADADFRGEIEIDRISHIYRDFLRIAEYNEKGHIGDAEGDCHLNVACPQGASWRNQINSVACISITGSTGSYLCSGAMINNTRLDKTPYLLTANHCLDGTSSTFKFYFLYEASTCDGTTGPWNKVCNGATIVARADLNTSSDFMLLRLTGTLSQTIQDSMFLAGWDATGTSSVGCAIHHPGGDLKKISIPRLITSPGGSTNKYWTIYWHTNPNLGVTEGGSSGSPLFNSAGNIIGDLSNGSSACDYVNGVDNYGKFSYSWTNNNNSSDAKKLQPWLDPDNTGALVLYGVKYNSGVGVEARNPVQSFSIVPNPTNGNVTIHGTFSYENGICNVYNTMGALVATQNVNLAPSFSLSFNDLPEGLYFVEIINGSEIYKSKMIINR